MLAFRNPEAAAPTPIEIPAPPIAKEEFAVVSKTAPLAMVITELVLNEPAAPSFSVPALMVVAPVYEFAAERVRFPEPDFVRAALTIEMTPETDVLPEPLKLMLPEPLIVGAIVKSPLPLWSIRRSVPAVRFPTPVPMVNSMLAAAPDAIEILLFPELAEKVRLTAVCPVLVVVKRVRRLVSAYAS